MYRYLQAVDRSDTETITLTKLGCQLPLHMQGPQHVRTIDLGSAQSTHRGGT
jgi:hypothetical protein